MSRAPKKDKWRRKTWYKIYAPSCFGGLEIGHTPSDDPSKLLGRTIETTLFDITQDPSHQYVTLYFQITKIDGTKANTIFKGHEYLGDYVKSLIRRRSSKVDHILNLTTKDGYQIRLSVVVLTANKITALQERSIRKVVNKKLIDKAKTYNFEKFALELALGNLNSEIFDEAKKVAALRHVGIFKSKLVSLPKERFS